MEDYTAELLVNSAGLGDGENLKRKVSDLYLGSRGALVDIKTENSISSRRCLAANVNPAPATL